MKNLLSDSTKFEKPKFEEGKQLKFILTSVKKKIKNHKAIV